MDHKYQSSQISKQITIPDIVQETEVDVALPNLWFRHLVCKMWTNNIFKSHEEHLRKHQVLSTKNLTGRRHAGQRGGDSKRDLRLAVHLPALGAETVLAALGSSELGLRDVEGADWTVQLL